MPERETVFVSYQGSDYSITSVFTNYETGSSILEAQPWWGNSSLSNALAGLVGYSSGYVFDGGSDGTPGILFAYGLSDSLVSIDYFESGSVINCPEICPPVSVDYYYAVIGQMLTLDSISDSLLTTSSGMSAVNNNINMLINGAHSRPLARRVTSGEKTFWAAGDWGLDDHGSRSGSSRIAEIGVGQNFGFAQLNLSLGHTWARQDMDFKGHTDVKGQYLMLERIIPVSEERGLFATVGGFGHWGEADIRRGYINMSALDSSKASPDTRTWGLRTRLDWVNALTLQQTAISPYADLSYTQTRVEGYREEGGGIPAQFDSQTERYTEARLGFNTATPLSMLAGFDLIANLEAAHRFEDQTAGVSGAVDGLFGFSLPGEKVENDWLKAGVGLEGSVGPGKLGLMLNGTTKSAMPNMWVAASYQLAF